MKALPAVMLALLAPLVQAQELTPQQLRGRAIYSEGKGSAIVAGQTIAARLVPCASCHGDDGRGQREGGTGVADITPPALSRNASVGARERPAYSPERLRLAITDGADSAGQPLDRVMPRYQLDAADAADLLAYLAMLDRVTPPGVSADTIRINVAGAAGLSAPPQTIYGRRIVLQPQGEALLTIDARASKAQQIAALRDYGRTRDGDVLLLSDDCAALSGNTTTPLVLMTADAATHCDLSRIAPSTARKIIVAAAGRPGDETQAAQAQLELAATILQRLGRDFTRKRFTEAWTQARRLQTARQQVWLMTLDVRQQTLLATPGWWPAAGN